MHLACACLLSLAVEQASGAAEGVRVQGPGVAPHLIFACCDQGVTRMVSLFSDPQVSSELKDLHAGIAIAISDFRPERRDLVRSMNQAGIPVIAWLMLSREQGTYFNAGNEQLAATRFAAFDAWSHEQGLRWQGVGLDIEPNFAELSALKGHWWRLSSTLLRRSFDGRRLVRAQQSYSELIGAIRARGYWIQTFQMPFVPLEREAHSTLLDRMLGTVDVSGDQDVVMLYSSFARPFGPGMIWTVGPESQAISVGVTDGGPGKEAAPLNWEEFSRDLILAGRFSRTVGVYNLEGCVHQGFLLRLESFDWNQSVFIPADALLRARILHRTLGYVLWIASHLQIPAAIILLVIITMVWWRRHNKRRKEIC